MNEPQKSQSGDGLRRDARSSATVSQSEFSEPSEASQDINNLPSVSALEEDILTALFSHPLYGLQICEAIDESSTGQQMLKIGSLYPSLHRLEKKGFVTSRMAETEPKVRGGNRRKYYKITMKGATALSQKQDMRRRLVDWSKKSSLNPA